MSGFNDFMNKAGAFASKAAGKAKDAAVAAAAKTKQLSRIAKLNMDISGQKDTVKKAYTELGRLYYEAHHDEPEEELAQVCQQIDMANASIAALEAEIAAIREEMDRDDAPEDADFASVVDSTEADVEVEIEEEPAAEGETVVLADTVFVEEPAAGEEPIAGEEPAVEEESVVEEEPAVEEGTVVLEDTVFMEEPAAEEEPAPEEDAPQDDQPHWY